MTLMGNNAITLRKLTSKVTAEKGIPLKYRFPFSILRFFTVKSQRYSKIGFSRKCF